MPATPLIWDDLGTINTTDNVSGNNNQRQVRVIQLDNGNLLYIWTSNADPASGAGSAQFQDIIGQIYDPLGNPVGGEFTVSTHIQGGSDGRMNGSVTALDDGGFIAVWRDLEFQSLGTPDNIEFRATIFDENGGVISEHVLTTGPTLGATSNVEVASLLHTNGAGPHVDIFVAYESGSNGEDLSFQVLNGSGAAFVAETDIMSQAGNFVRGHDVAALQNDTFAAAYVRVTSGGSESVQIRMYETDGTYVQVVIGGVPQGQFTTTNVSSGFNQYFDPSITVLSGGDVVISYTVDNTGGTDSGVRFRILADDYSNVVSETNPATTNTGSQALSEVVALDNNEFLVVWYDEPTHEIMGQRHSGTGVQIGSEFTIENYGTQVVEDISLESMDDGRVVISWTVDTAGNGEIQSEIYDPRDNAHDYVTDGGYQIGTTLDDDFTVDTGLSPHGDSATGIYAHGGNDTIRLTSDALNAGVVIDGGTGIDTIDMESGAGLVFDFRPVSLVSIEQLVLHVEGSTVQLREFQYASLSSITFTGAPSVETVEIYLNTLTNFTLALPTLTGMGTEDRFHIIGDGSAETITGSSLADIISGNAGSDILNGGGGDDMLIGGAGVDTFDGGTGVDTIDYSGGSAGAVIDMNAGTFSIIGGALVETFSNVENIIGTQGDDEFFEETGVANNIYGEGGVNTIHISSDIGEDNVYVTNSGTNIIDLSGNTQNGMVITRGSISLFAEHSGQTSFLNGSILTGTNQTDNFYSHFTHGVEFHGGGGDDYFFADGASDILDGGTGIDTLSFRLISDGVVDLDGGVTLDLIAGTAILIAESGVVSGVDTISNFEIYNGTVHADRFFGDATDSTFYGEGGNDTINGGSGNETIYGDDDGAFGTAGHGDDIINGGAGNDIIYGGDGDDIIDAGPGIDVVYAQAGADLVVISVGAGNGAGASYDGGFGSDIDTFDTSVLAFDGTYNLETHTFDAGLAGTDGDFEIRNFEKIIMGGGDDTIHAGYDNNVISLEILSGGGDDIVSGGRGNNVLDGGVGSDTLDYSYVSALAGSTITAITVDLAAGTATNEYGGSDTVSNFENAIGTSLDDTMTGDSGNNVLSGMDGDDILTGGTGNDMLIGGAGADTLTGGSGNDTIGYTGSDGAVTISLLAGTLTGGHATGDTMSGILNIIGSTFDDVLTGDGNKNTLDGDKGDDILDGGVGIDHLIGGQGDDILMGGADADINDGGSGFDTVDYSGASGSVKVYLSTGGTSGDADGDTYVSIERVIGTDFADIITGAAAGETLDGGLGDDELNGAGGSDIINGGAGNDLISGGAGLDTLDGGAGVDTVDYSGTTTAYDVNMVTGVTTLAGETAINFENIRIGDGDNVIVGTGAANNIQTNGGDDTIYAGLGNDTVFAGDGNDTVEGGDGDDTIYGGSGGDHIFGNDGNDTLEGGASIDDIRGGAGNDTINGGDGTDYLYGDDGDDTINGGAGNDIIQGGAGADTMDGGVGTAALLSYISGAVGVNVNLLTGTGAGGDAEGDVISNFLDLLGTNSNDTLTGDAQNNDINGASGNDVLDGGVGDDSLRGGFGADRILGGDGADANDGGAGFDAIDYRGAASRVVFDMTTSGTVGDAAGDTYTSIERAYGSNFNDTITGTSANEFFHGEDGDDTINAGDGLDRIYGGDGNDIQRGQGGNDLLYGSAGNDQLNGGTGFDIASYDNATSAVVVNLATGGTLGDAAGDTYFGIEVIYGSAFNDTITGNTSSNELRGEDGDDILDGGLGNDRLFGGLGADSLEGGGGADIAMYTVAEAGVILDLVLGGTGGEATGDSYSSIEWVFGSDFDDDITGDGAGNRLEGNDGNDTIDGAAGNDRLLGGNGDDIINGSDGVDSIFGQLGSDTLSGGAGNDFFFGSAGGDSMDGGSEFDTVNYLASTAGVSINLQTGGTGGDANGDTYVSIERVFGSQHDDVIDGSSGDDTLLGNGGADVMRGGLGADRLIGGAGDDSYVFDTTQDGADVFIGYLAGAAGAETIYITGGDAAFDTFAEIMAVTSQVGANTLIDFGSGNRITLLGITLGDLDTNDFTFTPPPAGEAPSVSKALVSEGFGAISDTIVNAEIDTVIADALSGKAAVSEGLGLISDVADEPIIDQDLVASFMEQYSEKAPLYYVDSNNMLSITAEGDVYTDFSEMYDVI